LQIFTEHVAHIAAVSAANAEAQAVKKPPLKIDLETSVIGP
jgi:hypothetical protein